MCIDSSSLQRDGMQYIGTKESKGVIFEVTSEAGFGLQWIPTDLVFLSIRLLEVNR